MNTLKKISRLFIAFLSLFVVLGFLMLFVRDYSTPIVNTVDAKFGGAITKTYNLSGRVRADNIVEVRALETLYAKEVKVENSQIAIADFPLIIFDYEKMSQSERERLGIGDDGGYRIKKDIYVEYINSNSVIEEGEVIARYALHDADSLKIEVEINDDVYYAVYDISSKIYYYKDYYSNRVRGKVSQIKEFEDHMRMDLQLNDNSTEKIRINNHINVIVEAREEYNLTMVPLTALIPIGELRSYTSCYIYTIDKQETIFGEDTRAVLRKAYIYAIGSNTAAIYIEEDENNPITDLKNLAVVNYATAAIENGSRVRIK